MHFILKVSTNNMVEVIICQQAYRTNQSANLLLSENGFGDITC